MGALNILNVSQGYKNVFSFPLILNKLKVEAVWNRDKVLPVNFSHFISIL